MTEPRPCKACGAPIIFVPTGETNAKGKPVMVPLDARKHGIYCIDPSSGLAIKATDDWMITHFATCPQASKFSGSKRPKEITNA